MGVQIKQHDRAAIIALRHLAAVHNAELHRLYDAAYKIAGEPDDAWPVIRAMFEAFESENHAEYIDRMLQRVGVTVEPTVVSIDERLGRSDLRLRVARDLLEELPSENAELLVRELQLGDWRLLRNFVEGDEVIPSEARSQPPLFWQALLHTLTLAIDALAPLHEEAREWLRVHDLQPLQDNEDA